MQKEKFKDIFNFKKKSKIKAGDGFKLGEGKYPFFTSSNVLTKSLNEYLFEEESLIFGTGGLASIHHCNEKFAVSTDCFVTQPKDKKQTFAKYVYYYLSGNIHILENGFKGAGLKHISKDFIENIEIPLPDLQTQQKIANILDKADELRQYNQQLIEKYDALTQSLFLDMFGDSVKNEKGWKIVQVENIASPEKHSIKAGPFGSSLKKEYYVEKGYKIYGQEQVIKDDMTYGNYYIDENKYKELESCIVNEGDVLVSLVGTYGKISVIPKEFEPGIINPRLMKISPNKDIIRPDFLKFLLQSSHVEKQLKSHSRGGTMDIINVGIIRKIFIPLPSITIQNQFAEQIKIIEAQKQQAKEALAKSELVFQGLLQQAFNGELN